jgi:hypothetical protein
MTRGSAENKDWRCAVAVTLRATLALAVIVLVTILSFSGAADGALAITAPQAIAYLDQRRESNGIPGGLSEDASLSQGCHDYTNGYIDAPGQFPHEERATQPGYTPLGAEAAAQSDLAGFFWSPSWTAERNPWWIPTLPPGKSVGTPEGVPVYSMIAPLHLTSLFNPAATTAWYGEHDELRGGGGACMGISGSRTFPGPAFFSFPGNGAANVPTWNIPSEIPWTPQMVLGLPQEQPTGTNFILWPEDTDAIASSATLTGPAGQQFPVSLVLPTMHTPADGDPQWTEAFVGELSGGASFAVPTKPLDPDSNYTLTVAWVSHTTGATYKQTVSFTTNSLTLRPRSIYIPIILNVADRHILTIHTTGHMLVGHPATITIKPCRIIPNQDECYGTRAVDYEKRVRLMGTTTRLRIPNLERDGEVNVTIDVAAFLIGGAAYGGGTEYSGGTDICWPRACAG